MGPTTKSLLAALLQDGVRLGFGVAADRLANIKTEEPEYFKKAEEEQKKIELENEKESKKEGDNKKLSAAIEELESIKCGICKWLIDDNVKSLRENQVIFDQIDEVYRLKKDRFGKKRWDELTEKEKKDFIKIVRRFPKKEKNR